MSIPLYGAAPGTPVRLTGVLLQSLILTACATAALVELVNGLMTLLAPLILLVVYRWVRGWRAQALMTDVQDRARADLERALGRTLVHADFGAVGSAARGGVVATGLAYDGTRLFSIEESVAESIAWRDVRRFEWRIEADQSVHIDVHVHAPGGTFLPDFGQHADAQARRDAAALRSSGFFLHVADVQRPVRQFVCGDRAVLQRWFEILTQMKEGRIRVA